MSNSMKNLVIAIVIVLSAAASLAQENLSESIEVRVVNVDVVVRDRAGKPVTGLTKDAFEIYENGEKRAITNLYEVAGAPGAAPAAAKATTPAEPAQAGTEAPVEIRPRNIVMFIDNYSLEPFRRDKVLQSLRKLVDEQLRPQDQVMIVLCTQQLKVITPFTSDKKVIEAGIASVGKTAGAGLNRTSELALIKTRITEFIDSHKDNLAEAAAADAKPGGGNRPVFFEWKDFFSKSLSVADAYVEEEILSSRNTLTALGQVAASLAGLEGKNVIIFAGAHLPEHPGAELYLWLYNAFSPYLATASMTTEAINGKAGSMQHYSIEEAANQASANNVALYIIDAADARDIASAEHAMPVDKAEQFATFTNTAMAYQTLARISGGLALTNSDNFDSAFQSLAADLNSYYSLGFKPANTTTTTLGRIVVKMKNREYRFRARETYLAKPPVVVMSGAMNGPTTDGMETRVIANLYNADPHNTWDVQVNAGAPEKEGDQYKVPFVVTFAPTITLTPQGTNLAGNFTVYVVVGSGSATSKVIRNAHTINVPSDAEDDFREKKNLTYKAAILMTPGENILSVGLVDQASNKAGFARAKVTIP